MKTNPPSHLARHIARKGAAPALDTFPQKNSWLFYENFFFSDFSEFYYFLKKNSFRVKYRTGPEFVKMFQIE